MRYTYEIIKIDSAKQPWCLRIWGLYVREPHTLKTPHSERLQNPEGKCVETKWFDTEAEAKSTCEKWKAAEAKMVEEAYKANPRPWEE